LSATFPSEIHILPPFPICVAFLQILPISTRHGIKHFRTLSQKHRGWGYPHSLSALFSLLSVPALTFPYWSTFLSRLSSRPVHGVFVFLAFHRIPIRFSQLH
jgi:hypothetical protein